MAPRPRSAAARREWMWLEWSCPPAAGLVVERELAHDRHRRERRRGGQELPRVRRFLDMTKSETQCNLAQIDDTPPPDLTVAVQDYLKAIYVLESAGERVTTSALARAWASALPRRRR